MRLPSYSRRKDKSPKAGPGRTALLFLLFAASCVPVKAQQSGNVIRFVRNPDLAPEFKVPGLDGQLLSLADERGKVILLNFWATWCGPCRAEIPDLIELQTRYKDHLQIIGLTVDEDDAGLVKKVVEETGINYPVAMAPAEVRLKYGGIAALPTSFVLDSEGRVVQKHEGLRDPVLYETEIRSLLGLPIDPTNGVGDIERKELRAIHNYAFYDDPARMLRLIRFKVRLSFVIDDRTRLQYENAREAEMLTRISPESLGIELRHMANEPAAPP